MPTNQESPVAPGLSTACQQSEVANGRTPFYSPDRSQSAKYGAIATRAGRHNQAAPSAADIVLDALTGHPGPARNLNESHRPARSAGGEMDVETCKTPSREVGARSVKRLPDSPSWTFDWFEPCQISVGSGDRDDALGKSAQSSAPGIPGAIRRSRVLGHHWWTA